MQGHIPKFDFLNQLSLYGTLENINLRIIEKDHFFEILFVSMMIKELPFVGDLLFIDDHPCFGHGDPWQLKRATQFNK